MPRYAVIYSVMFEAIMDAPDAEAAEATFNAQRLMPAKLHAIFDLAKSLPEDLDGTGLFTNARLVKRQAPTGEPPSGDAA